MTEEQKQSRLWLLEDDPKKKKTTTAGKKRKRSKQKNEDTVAYLRPGALARLRDARRRDRPSLSSSLKKKASPLASVARSDGDSGNAQGEGVREEEREEYDGLLGLGYRGRRFGPLNPSRKKLSAVRRAPEASPNPVGVRTPLAPIAPESALEALPIDILVRIVCHFRHDQLKAAFHVCKRLREAVIMARKFYFDYITPHREGLARMTVPDRRRKRTERPDDAVANPPKRHVLRAGKQVIMPRSGTSSTTLEEVQIQSLLQSSSKRSHDTRHYTSRPCSWRRTSRALASHRALFSSDELHQAVA